MDWSLTNPGLIYGGDQIPQVDPMTGTPIVPYAPPSKVKFFNNDAARNAVAQPALQAVDRAIQSAPLQVTPPQVSFSDAGQDASGNPLPPQMSASGGGIVSTPNLPALPQMFKPKFQDVSQGPYGLPTQINPAETKLGKLLHILRAVGEGAAAGSQAGTFGGGFEAAQQEPYQDAARKIGIQNALVDQQMRQAELAMLPWRRAQAMYALQKEQGEAAKAPYITPRAGGVFDPRTGRYVPGAEPAPKEGNPDLQTFNDLTSKVDPQLGRPLTPIEATARIAETKQAVKPEKTPNRDDEAIRIYTEEAKTANPSLTPDQAYKAGYQRWVKETKTDPGMERALMFAASRGVSNVYDTATGNVAPVTWKQLNEAPPGRYLSGSPLGTIDPETGNVSYLPSGPAMKGGAAPAGPGAKAMAQQAQFGEMHFAAGKVRAAIDNLDRPFSPTQIAKLTLAMRHTDPTVFATEMDTILGTQKLTEPQQEFVTWIAQLNERALSLRSVAGMGQGSEQMRDAIRATLPGLKSGDKNLMRKQLNAFENQVTLLERGVPKVKGQQPIQQSGSPAAESGKYAPGFSPL